MRQSLHRVAHSMALLSEDHTLDDLIAQAAAGNVQGECFVFEKWCKGKLSAEEVVDGATMPLGREGEGEDLLSRLSRVNPHNAHRDIERMLRPRCTSTLPPIYDADLPLWDA